MKICYYAHCMSIYGTPQEARDRGLICALGFVVSCPNTEDVQRQCDKLDGIWEKTEVMNRVFRPLVVAADVVCFRALPDGSISSGVARELDWAVEEGKPIFELPSSIQRRALSLKFTREYLREVGQR